MKIELGKKYRSRRGDLVKILGWVRGEVNPFRGDNGETYKEDGTWGYIGGHSDPLDLVSEYTGNEKETPHP